MTTLAKSADPKRIDISKLTLAQLVEKLSAHVARMHGIQINKQDMWPEEFKENFEDDVSILDEIDERFRMKLRMQPRVKTHRPYQRIMRCKDGTEALRSDFTRTKNEVLLAWTGQMVERLEQYEAHLAKDLFSDADAERLGEFGSEDKPTRAKHNRTGRTISLILEVAKRFAAALEGKLE